MRATLVLGLLLLPACSAFAPSGERQASSPGLGPNEAARTITAKAIQAHVDYLASDELQGRYARSAEARLAADYIAEQFEAAGLSPLGDEGTYFQWLEDRAYAPNVVGLLRGTGAGYVVLTAHYDHLKPATSGEDRIFNGADDNASGTAAVMEAARAFAALGERPSASLVFIAFTAEEGGLRGSRHFVEHAPFSLADVKGAVNLDMISRGEENLIFCEGGPKAPRLFAATRRANAEVGLEIRYDQHPEWLSQSDHYWFLQNDVPTLYFGVEDHPDYHRVSDHADRILAGLATKVTRLVFLLALDVAQES